MATTASSLQLAITCLASLQDKARLAMSHKNTAGSQPFACHAGWGAQQGDARSDQSGAQVQVQAQIVHALAISTLGPQKALANVSCE